MDEEIIEKTEADVVPGEDSAVPAADSPENLTPEGGQPDSPASADDVGALGRREEKERQKQQLKEEKEQKRVEKKTARETARQERRKEAAVMLHTVELVMLLVFIVLAIDQAGLYGFLFVWVFIAVMAASIALLLLGIIRQMRHKRSGIILTVAILGILLCAAWFIYLLVAYGLGPGPVPN